MEQIFCKIERKFYYYYFSFNVFLNLRIIEFTVFHRQFIRTTLYTLYTVSSHIIQYKNVQRKALT